MVGLLLQTLYTVVSKHHTSKVGSSPPTTSSAFCAVFLGFQFSHEPIHIPPCLRDPDTSALSERPVFRGLLILTPNSLVGRSITTDLELAEHRVGTTKQWNRPQPTSIFKTNHLHSGDTYSSWTIWPNLILDVPCRVQFFHLQSFIPPSYRSHSNVVSTVHLRLGPKVKDSS